MALIDCKECGREISTEAVACPGCGVGIGMPKAAPSWIQNITNIKCKECGENFSSKEKSCPKCGAKVTIPLASKIMAVVILLIIAVFVFIPSDDKKSNSDTTIVTESTTNSSIEAPLLAPEMLVKPVHGQFLAACQSRELLNELLGHATAQEKTKLVAMFDRFDCSQIPETETYKILSVSRGMVEIVNVNAKLITDEGMWAVADAMRPLK